MSQLTPAGYRDDEPFGLATPGVESFHRALQAALHSGATLDLGRGSRSKAERDKNQRQLKVPAGRLTPRKLQALRELAKTSAENRNVSNRSGQPIDPTAELTAAFGKVADILPQKYVAGFSFYLVTGRTDLVIDAMSVDMRAQRELSRVARPSLAYLVVLVTTAALGSGVLAFVLMVVGELREDLPFWPHRLEISPEVNPWITESQFYMLPWIALVILLVALASLLPRVSAGIAKCLGGFGYLVSQRRAMAARVEHALVLSGIDGAEAEQTATQLVGFQPQRKRAIRTVSRNDQSPSDLQRSSLEAKHYHARSNTRLRQLRFGLPILLVLTVGSAGVLLYSLALFVPLTHLMYELASPAVDPAMGRDKR